MKKILIISGVFPPEPVTSANMNFDLALALAREHDVTVIIPHPSRPISRDYSAYKHPKYPFKLVVVDSFTHPKSTIKGRMKESISFSKKAIEYIESIGEKIDFIYNSAWQYWGYYLIAKYCVKNKIPYIVPIQDIYPESLLTKLPFPHLIKVIVKRTLIGRDIYYQKNAACIRTITTDMADYLSLSRGIDRSKFLVVANWQNDDEFKHLIEKPIGEKKVITFLGNIARQANVDLIIRAFAIANVNNAELRIMGGGPAKEDCVNLAKKLRLNNIIFGEVPNGKVAEVQSEADILILALKTGTGKLGLPSKLVSYMQSGKPVIASLELDSATAHIIEEAKCGKCVEEDDVEKLAELMREMLSLPTEELLKMGRNSRQYAMMNLTKERNLQKVVDKINEILLDK